MYFKYLHPHLPTLDVAHSSPSAVARRNNFLFNASKSSHEPLAHLSLLHCCSGLQHSSMGAFARIRGIRDGATTPRKERRGDTGSSDLLKLEVSVAFPSVLTISLIRPKNFEQDLTWVRVGIAMRTSMDINLHRVALLKEARDGLPTWLLRSIIRTWLCGFILDRTLSAQLGKPSSIRGENSVSFYMDLIRQGMQGGKDDVRVASLAVSQQTNPC